MVHDSSAARESLPVAAGSAGSALCPSLHAGAFGSQALHLAGFALALLACLSLTSAPLSADAPGPDKSAGADKPGADKPGADKPGADKPGADKPGADKPGADKPGDKPSESEPSKASEPWCAPELERLPLSDCEGCEPCAFQPELKQPTDTLVVFLHGVVKADSGWQYNQQRALVRAAKANGFDLVAPRGRRGIGPKDMEDWWTWPTRSALQPKLEPELFGEWRRARALLEARREQPYKKLVVVGFSNGAYYASSLVLRGAFEADGYATLAGGGANYLERTARAVKQRAPVYVGYGLKDKSARKDSAGFGRLLKRLGWKHQVKARPKVGHSMTDAQLAEALRFLRGG